MTSYISRLVREATAHNTLNLRAVSVRFQRSPGFSSADVRGIADLEFQVRRNGTVTQRGRTGADGKIIVMTAGGRATLELMAGGNVVSTYDITLREEGYEGDTTIAGIQRRLRTLGYHIGHDGTDQSGVDDSIGKRTDRAILDFQIDNGLAFDGKVGRQTRSTLNDICGGSAEPPRTSGGEAP